jgi:hypothetical protein
MKNPQKPTLLQPAEDVYGWVEQESSVMFKAVTQHGDPVELSAAEARQIAEALLELAAQLESMD